MIKILIKNRLKKNNNKYFNLSKHIFIIALVTLLKKVTITTIILIIKIKIFIQIKYTLSKSKIF